MRYSGERPQPNESAFPCVWTRSVFLPVHEVPSQTNRLRIAYIAPYQGPTLVSRRPIHRNRSLAATVKIELVAELLQKNSHEVEVISQGEVIEKGLRLYRAFREPHPFHPEIRVEYSSALPLPFVNGFWSSASTLRCLRSRHRATPFDLVMIYNFKMPQMVCANYAMRCLGLPVILEYEDDTFVDVDGEKPTGFRSSCHLYASRKTLEAVSACIGVSPYLLSQVSSSIPKLLVPGVVSDEILRTREAGGLARKNWIVFSGTLYKTKGLEKLITGWNARPIENWELHIAGDGELNTVLREMARENSSIVFHGLLDRNENARLLCSGMIGINPHDLSERPGNVFAFKIMEYLAAGLHVLSTPMGQLDPAIEAGITYMTDNQPHTIMETLRRVIEERQFMATVAQTVQATYGSEGLSRTLEALLDSVVRRGQVNPA